MKRVVLHIDRLVLEGARPEDRHAIGESLRLELGRQLARPQLVQDLSARRDAARVRIGPVSIRTGSPAGQVGTQVARGIARGLKS